MKKVIYSVLYALLSCLLLCLWYVFMGLSIEEQKQNFDYGLEYQCKIEKNCD